MALALLEPGAGAEFLADTGTSRFYELRVGRSVRTTDGIDMVDDLVLTTPLAENPASGDPLAPPLRVPLPSQRFDGSRLLAQLVSFRSRDRDSPAFSDVLPFSGDGPSTLLGRRVSDLADPMSPPTDSTPTPAGIRRVRCRSGAEAFAEQASFGDVLAHLANLAGPAVSTLLASQGGAATAARPTASPPGASSSASGAGATAAGVLAAVIDAVLRALAAPAPTSQPHSLGTRPSTTRGTRFAEPFIFGIDDVLIGTLVSSVAGPLIQALPQLANILNQRRLGTIQANNQQNATLLNELNRRILLERITEARHTAAADPATADTVVGLEQLEALLRAAAPAANALPATPSPQVARQASVSTSVRRDAGPRPAARSVLEMVTAAPIVWNGAPTLLLSKAGPVRLRMRLQVAAPVPATPLPRAILRLVVQDARTHRVLAEQSTRLQHLTAGGVVSVDVEPLQLARIPVGRPVSLLAELRWPTRVGTVAALGSFDAVFVGERFLRSEGPAVGVEQDLADMSRFRAFWNKMWESPSAAPGRKLWDIDVNTKFSVLISPDHESNGAMEPRLQRTGESAEGVTERLSGRLKAGIEVAVAELAAVRALWPDEPPLPAGVVEALRTERFARDYSGEVVTSLRLRGRIRERGLLWAVPTLRLTAFTFSTVTAVDDAGQVIGVVDEVVRFPVPIAVRFFGLLGTADAGDTDDDGNGHERVAGDDDRVPLTDAPDVEANADRAVFDFAGYETVFARKVTLSPIAGPPVASH